MCLWAEGERLDKTGQCSQNRMQWWLGCETVLFWNATILHIGIMDLLKWVFEVWCWYWCCYVVVLKKTTCWIFQFLKTWAPFFAHEYDVHDNFLHVLKYVFYYRYMHIYQLFYMMDHRNFSHATFQYLPTKTERHIEHALGSILAA